MSERTIRLYRIDIADFLKYCGEDIEFISDITSSTVDNYILNRRQSQSCSQITINSHLRSIRAFLYWAMEERYINYPFTFTIPKAEKKHFRKGEPDDYVFCNSYGLQAYQRTIQEQLANSINLVESLRLPYIYIHILLLNNGYWQEGISFAYKKY